MIPAVSGDRPLVSAVIPAFNAEKYLVATLDSIRDQDYPSIEVIVVDDGSSDATAELAASYGDTVRCIRQPHRGLSAAQNHGVGAATGEYLSFLDADDLWLPYKTSRQIAVMDEDPDIDVVFGYVEQFVDRPDATDASAATTLPENRRRMPGYIPGAMLVRRTVFEQVGPFDETVKLGQFIDWYARAVQRGIKSHMVADVVMRRRIHDTNMGIRMRDERGDYVRVLKSALDRRRGLSAGS